MRSRALLPAAGLALASTALTGVWFAADAADPEAPAALPELPSVQEQVEGLYDDQGCLRIGVDAVDCSVRAEELDQALSHGRATETRRLEGFVGSRWVGQVDGDGPTVLTGTVQAVTDGPFRATGLARNESAVVLADLQVTARLVGGDGRVLDEVSVPSPVRDIRPGEPVPFAIDSAVPAGEVDQVEWSVAGGDTGDETARALAWTPYWERPAGGDAVDLYLYGDGPGPRPHLLFGSAVAVGDLGVDHPEVVVAWLSRAGRLVSITSAPLRGPDGGAVSHLEPGAAADGLLVADNAPPVDGEALVWVQAT